MSWQRNINLSLLIAVYTHFNLGIKFWNTCTAVHFILLFWGSINYGFTTKRALIKPVFVTYIFIYSKSKHLFQHTEHSLRARSFREWGKGDPSFLPFPTSCPWEYSAWSQTTLGMVQNEWRSMNQAKFKYNFNFIWNRLSFNWANLLAWYSFLGFVYRPTFTS